MKLDVAASAAHQNRAAPEVQRRAEGDLGAENLEIVRAVGDADLGGYLDRPPAPETSSP